MTTVQMSRAAYAPGSEYTETGWTAFTQRRLLLDIQQEGTARKARPQPRELRGQLDVALVQTTEGRWIADERVTTQFGVGVTPKDAVADLMETLKNYLEVLRAHRYSLAPYLREHLQWLEGRIS